MSQRTRINENIRAKELRVIGPKGENFGVLERDDAIAKAKEEGLDLIEISPDAKPPVAKIMDYGKYQYLSNKKQKQANTKSHSVEVKSIQIKIGTGDHDLMLKAKKVGEWLSEGNRVKINLFLPGRAKYLDKKFLKDRIDRFLKFIPHDYKIDGEPKKSPKGMTVMVEQAK